MSKNLEGKTIVITGAAHGLGKELTKQLSEKKARLILIDIDASELEKVATSFQASSFVCDIRDLAQVESVASEIKSQTDVDILINVAGVWTDDNLEKQNTELRKNAFDVNVYGQINVINQFLPSFKDKNSGTIVNVISTAGVPDVPAGNNQHWKSYGASKWAMVGYTQALRQDLAETKIKLIQFYPGGFESDLYASAGRENAHNQSWMMSVADVAEVLVFALTRPIDMCMEKIVVTKA